ncbi:MAG: Tricarboxylate transporter family protein, partial [Rhodobacteraceae bacterium]|nr:Tricarboxylate transporter family protein [Paracoccaceae bacterium]
RMGPVEVFALMIFAFSILLGLIGQSLIKGITAAALGLLAASIESDSAHYSPRVIFGYYEVYDGLRLASVAIFMLAISEIIPRLSQMRGHVPATNTIDDTGNRDDRRVTFAEYWGCRFTMLRWAMIGTVLGALSGIGRSPLRSRLM